MSAAMLEVRGLSARHGGLEVLHRIDLEVREGERVALLGGIGAGKSTLLAALAGLHREVSGTVRWLGRDLCAESVTQVFQRGLVLVPEGRGVFRALSVRDNLLLALDARRLGRGLRRQELDRILEFFPQIRELLPRAGAGLSGGQLQLVALARALLCRPRLLMLDEPSMGLAPALVDAVFDVLARIHAEGTSVLVAERNAYQALSIADRAYVLEGGCIERLGSASELRRDPVLMARLGAR